MPAFFISTIFTIVLTKLQPMWKAMKPLYKF